MVVLGVYEKFSIHTLQPDRSIVIIRENSLYDKYGEFEKTTHMQETQNLEELQKENKNGQAPLNHGNKMLKDEKIKQNNVREARNYFTTATMRATKTSTTTSTPPTPTVLNNQVGKENLENETSKNKGVTKLKNNSSPPTSLYKYPGDLTYEEILKERKRLVKQSWGSGKKIDFDKLGLGLDKVNRATSKKTTGNVKTNLKKRQTYRNRYYDLALTLGKIKEINNPRHAEQYLADLVNMLQVYYKRHSFNGYSFRLSGTYYLEKHAQLVDVLDLSKTRTPEASLGIWSDYAGELNFQTFDMKFFLPFKPNWTPNFSQVGIANRDEGCHKSSATGFAYISDFSITNPYELIGILVHEFGHSTGIKHNGENMCKDTTYKSVMEPYRYHFSPWLDFSRCGLNTMICFPSGNF
ncbi:hypothetical protein HMI54_008345 [Coelomomyces lativittatus]|nr:hypothetical protein HMI56_004532 [Coelomomyces lativittatus]KAJ1503175.1 hypothetical protein HMI54_008345 [Coelomomyces lativittatus]KAJ1517002.1 hypothetical protein HMI55_000868 [Coelomomyces lativittatus]